MDSSSRRMKDELLVGVASGSLVPGSGSGRAGGSSMVISIVVSEASGPGASKKSRYFPARGALEFLSARDTRNVVRVRHSVDTQLSVA